MKLEHEVFSASELARAVGVHSSRITQLIADGAISIIEPASSGLVSGPEALRAGRSLRRPRPRKTYRTGSAEERPLLSLVRLRDQGKGVPMAVSSILHATLIAGVVLVTGSRADTFTMTDVPLRPEPLRLVYLATPGPAGGGGGGGHRAPAPPPTAKRQGPRSISSPLPLREAPPPIEPTPAPVEQSPPVIEAEPIAPIVAPIVVLTGDTEDRAGIVEDREAAADRHGPGDGGGEGVGRGTGVGGGDGPGVGPGSGGGIGGGPYGPGSGVEPPRLLHEVKPDYPESARRQGIVGHVILEIIVASDGTVESVRTLQRLSPELDQQAVAAVRQWRFAPATLRGTPVDVLVEVAVEFKQR